MTRILAVHAHPDDLETLAAGTLALLASDDCEIVMATLTAGECGAVTGDPAETGRIRQAEAQAAAAQIGADYICLGLPDLGVFNDDPARRLVTGLIRRTRPDMVITAPVQDYHPDHEATGILVRDACFASSVAGYRTDDAAPLNAIPHLYMVDPIGGRTRDGAVVTPDFAVDIGAAMATKRLMLRAHESQIAWVKRQHGLDDFAAAMETHARRRGRDFGIEFAEAFRQYRGTPYPRTPALQTLLGAVVLRPKA